MAVHVLTLPTHNVEEDITFEGCTHTPPLEMQVTYWALNMSNGDNISNQKYAWLEIILLPRAGYISSRVSPNKPHYLKIGTGSTNALQVVLTLITRGPIPTLSNSQPRLNCNRAGELLRFNNIFRHLPPVESLGEPHFMRNASRERGVSAIW